MLNYLIEVGTEEEEGGGVGGNATLIQNVLNSSTDYCYPIVLRDTAWNSLFPAIFDNLECDITVI